MRPFVVCTVKEKTATIVEYEFANISVGSGKQSEIEYTEVLYFYISTREWECSLVNAQ